MCNTDTSSKTRVYREKKHALWVIQIKRYLRTTTVFYHMLLNKYSLEGHSGYIERWMLVNYIKNDIRNKTCDIKMWFVNFEVYYYFSEPHKGN